MTYRTNNAEAIVWVTIATALFSLIFSAGKFADASASVFQINFLRITGGVLALAVVAAAKGDGLATYRSRRPVAHFLRSVFGVVGALAIVQASADMPIVDATAMSLLYVVFVVLLGMVFFREKIGSRQWTGIVLACCGAVTIMVSRGAFQHFDLAYVRPALLAVLGACLFAFEGILIKLLSKSDKPMTVMLHVNVYGVLMLAVPAFLFWRPLPFVETCAYVLLGPVGVAAQYCVIRGYRMADISVVGPVDYSWLIFASLIGFFFFDEIPTFGVIIGAGLIAAGGIVLALVKPAPQKQPVMELQ